MILRRTDIKSCFKNKYYTTLTTFSNRHLKDLETSIAKQMESYIKHNNCGNKTPTAISGEHNIKRSYSSINALHCLENLYAVILPFGSRVNTRRDLSFTLKSRARSRGRVSTNQISETKICVHKLACTNVPHTKKKSHRRIYNPYVLCATSD